MKGVVDGSSEGLDALFKGTQSQILKKKIQPISTNWVLNESLSLLLHILKKK